MSEFETAMTDRENDALRATNIDQAAEIGILRTEKHADAEAIGSQAAEIERLRAALGDASVSFSKIHRVLIDCLDEPLRSAFWMSVSARALARAALAQEAQTNE